MNAIPEKLQGTDGIRGRITSDDERKGINPMDFYLEKGLLTPGFFELYTYAFGRLIIEKGFAVPGEPVVIGWDARDKEGEFNQAAINGIRKTGLKAIVAGTLPTPAIPLYMQYKSAIASVVLTASHNPSDQNGIKLFCGVTALKLLPADDIALTKLIFKLKNLELSSVKLLGDLEYKEEKAKKFFVNFCLDPRNSWIESDSFADTILVVDASKGATASVVSDIFSQLPFKQVHFTNLEGNINEHCGVADIEGQETITRSEVITKGSRFSSYEALVKMFNLSDEVANDLAGNTKLVALVFDGDGDRCFRLDYLPEKDCLHVSSGDHLGIHQARYIVKEKIESEALFVNTVESDLNTAITAREIGFSPILTGVGDKWILLRAVQDLISASIAQEPEKQKVFDSLLNEENGPSAISLSKASKTLPSPDQQHLKFKIGLEESGHSITPGFLGSNDSPTIVFSGNGIKTGLNSIKAIAATTSQANWFQQIEQPFAAGIRKTYYTYYVDKGRLAPQSPFRQQFQDLLKKRFPETFNANFEIQLIEYPEEPEMLYFSILENQKQCGAIFVRNSGTEDKSALYLRGETRLSESLQLLGEELHLYILLGQKVVDNEFTKFEVDILEGIAGRKPINAALDNNPNLPHDRVLKEIELKEGLIQKDQGDYQLTEKGQKFINSWK